MADIHSYNSEQTWVEATVTSIHSRILKKNLEGSIFRLALSGGSTPGPIYSALAEYDDIDWSKVELYLVDERYVPHKDKDSNHRLITESLISKLPQKPAEWVSFDTSLDIPECLEKYEEAFEGHKDPFFDLILLGMGTDGHSASLFPKSKALSEKKHWVAHSTTEDNVVKDRLTLTYPALESAAEVFFLLKGKAKRAILDAVATSSAGNAKLPAARIFHRDGVQVFFGEY